MAESIFTEKKQVTVANVMFLSDSSKKLMFYTLLLGMLLFQLKYYFLRPVNMAVWSTCLSMCDVLGSIPSTIKNSGITIRYRIKVFIMDKSSISGVCLY